MLKPENVVTIQQLWDGVKFTHIKDPNDYAITACGIVKTGTGTEYQEQPTPRNAKLNCPDCVRVWDVVTEISGFDVTYL